jgi:uncharacterized protein (DUF58 family)
MKWDKSLIRWLFVYLWGFKLTRFGKVLIFIGLLSGSFIAWSIEILTFDLFMILFCVGFFALLLNYAWRTRFDVQFSMPGKAAAGATFQGTVRVRNAGRLPAYDVGVSFFDLPPGLRDALPERYLSALAPGESAEFPIAIHALRRGSYSLPPLRAYTAFPLGLLRSGKSRAMGGNLLVLPAFTPAEGIALPVSRRYQPGGVAYAANVGESPEYIGNREFRPGDSIRRIDMRAWGRTGTPVVREFQEEYFLRVALVLDTYQPRFRWPYKPENGKLESAISLTASLVDALSRGEYLLDIFAAGPELYNFRTGRGASHFDTVLEILACIGPCPTNPFEIITPALADELGNISTVIFVFLDWDVSRREMARAAIERGCRIRLFIVKEGETALPLPADEAIDVTKLSPAMVLEGRLGVL